jgi:hypothetical protein
MNRTIAVFLGLMVLLAHALAIHGDGAGGLAPVYERAYAALRLGRNLVQEGALRWNPAEAAHESYPSLVWALWIALGERTAHLLHVTINHWAQFTGLAAAIATVVLASRFHLDRVAGAIGPLLLVTSGSLAAAATAGTETAAFALCVTATFVAHERRWSLRFALCAALTCALLPEGIVPVAVLLALRLLPSGPDEPAPPPLVAFLPAALVVLGATLLRLALFGAPLPPLAASLLEDPARWREGALALRDFFLTGGPPLLVVFPLGYLLRGRLSRSGRDALLVAAAWMALVAWIGGGPLPFFALLLPALPLLYHAVQEGLLCALDSTRAWLRRAALAGLVGGLVLGALASAFPGDRGPLSPSRAAHEAWMANALPQRPGYAEPRGRLGLAEELRVTRRLHAIGIYLRDGVEPGTRVLSPWPATIAYLSRLPVDDMLGRATPAPGERRVRPWERPSRCDVLAWLGTAPDLVVPSLAQSEAPPSREAVAREWLGLLDSRADAPGRLEALVAELAAWELVTVPIYEWVEPVEEWSGTPFHLLRRRALEQRPRLELHLEDGELAVIAVHEGPRQIVDLSLEVEDQEGRTWYRRPTGAWTAERVVARRALLVYPAGSHRIELVRAALGALPEGARPRLLRAILLNPGARERAGFAAASEPAELVLR